MSSIYLTNKYTTWYNSIIASAQVKVNRAGYLESHHIIPKSLGGSNDISNKVSLTPKEHYICHLLLTKMVEGVAQRKMWYAHYMMMKGIKRYRPSSRMYDLAKRNLSLANKDRPGPNLGRKLPGVSEANKLKKGVALPKRSSEHCAKLSFPKSDDTKRKLSEARLGKTFDFKHSDNTKSKMSAWQKGIPKEKVKCPHCDKETSLMNYSRWHGKNCKQYKD